MHRKVLLIFLLLMLASCIAYNVFDNQRFVVVEKEIAINRLPSSFNGFRILQISDLHGRYFGKQQENLVAAINRLDFDMIAFTGDMNASTSSLDSIENSQAVLDLLDGITNKEAVFWVDGNTGPFAIQGTDGLPYGITDIGRVLEEKGCIILTKPYMIQRGQEHIWITPRMMQLLFDQQKSRLEDGHWTEEKADSYRMQLEQAYASFQAILGNKEVKIMLTHYPRQPYLPDEAQDQWGELDYDLILAGHYHGGQVRLPWIGAVYIPSPTLGINNSGFFPEQSAVNGLGYSGEVPQYVSAGLGASNHIPMLNFRLFNTPEINLITLVTQ